MTIASVGVTGPAMASSSSVSADSVWSASSSSVDLALSANGGVASASSTLGVGGELSTLIDGVRQGGSGGWWADDPSGPEPAWAQVEWASEQTLGRVVLRMPVVTKSVGVGERTFGETVVQFWNGDSWQPIAADGNPIENWVAPTTDDGSQVRTLQFDAVSTSKIRVLFVVPNSASDAGLEEIEAYGI